MDVDLVAGRARVDRQVIFGENYVQEFTAKAVEVAEPLEWHFIGHLQSNKVKYLAGLVTLVVGSALGACGTWLGRALRAYAPAAAPDQPS